MSTKAELPESAAGCSAGVEFSNDGKAGARFRPSKAMWGLGPGSGYTRADSVAGGINALFRRNVVVENERENETKE